MPVEWWKDNKYKIYTQKAWPYWHKDVDFARIIFIKVSSPHHLHRCPQHRHLPLRCCLCLFGLGYYCRGSCHSGHPHHHDHSHTAWGCTRMDSCPVSKKERQRGREKFEDRFSGREWCGMKRCFIFRSCPSSNVGISEHTVPLLQSCTAVLEFEVLTHSGSNICCPAEPPLPSPSTPAYLLNSMNGESKNDSHRTHTHTLTHSLSSCFSSETIHSKRDRRESTVNHLLPPF